jgi:cobalt-zinc-cadmium efflux system membrane fusion protein
MKAGNYLAVLAFFVLVACQGGAPDPSSSHDHSEDEHDGEEGLVVLSNDAVSRAGIRSEPAKVGNLDSGFETTGLVDFNQDRIAHLGPRLRGRVQEVRATLGQRVNQGDILAVINSVELGRAKVSYLNARAQLDLARKTYDREKDLYDKEVVSERKLLATEAAFNQATAELATATQALRLYDLTEQEIQELQYEDPRASLFPIRAPFAGKIIEKEVALSEVVNPDSTLFALADLSRVWIWIDLYENSLRHVSLEDHVEVRLDAYPDALFKGRISYLGDEVDGDTRTLRARIDVANPRGEIRPGLFARVRLSSLDATSKAVDEPSLPLVPEGALQRDGTEFIVFVALAENQFERREVRPGRKSGGWVEILEGLEGGEPVVVEGSFLLKSEASKERMGGHAH